VIGSVAPGTSAIHALPYLAQYYVDVATAGEIFGGILSFDSPVDGYLADQDGNILSPFSYDPQTGFGQTTWQTYNGLLRFPTPGRYYFAVTTASATTLTATSSFAPVAPTPVTPDGTQVDVAEADLPAYNGTAYTFTSATVATGYELSSSKPTDARLFDASTAFGRLGSVALSSTTRPPDPAPAATFSISGDVSVVLTPTSYILELDDVDTFGRGYTLAIGPEPATGTYAFGPATPPSTQTATTSDLGLALISGPPGSVVSIDATSAGGIDLELLDATYEPRTFLGSSATEVATAIEQDTSGFMLLDNFDGAMTITVSYAAPPTYTVTTGSDAFVEQCGSGNFGEPIAFGADGLATGVPYLGRFTYFGIATPGLTMSANGFLSFHTPTGALPVNEALPAADDAFSIVAPYWANLDGVTACANVIDGVKATYEWNGHLAGDLAHVVQMQVILTLADNSIEFVYGPNHTAGGATASIGIHDSLGIIGKSVAFHTPHAVAAGTSTKLTPTP
jgi:hypothetical protein